MTRGNAQGFASEQTPALAGLASHSRMVQRLRRRYPDELGLLPAGTPSRASLVECLATLRARGHDTGAALRILRQLVLERLVVLDCEQGAALATVTGVMTALAELALDVACADAFAHLDARHGEPRAASGARTPFWVMGMGKLGARELNVSSDIDLVYLYDEEGETRGLADGRGRVSVHEYFTRAARHIGALIGDVTEHGFVFRVDLALRPNGNSGPTVCSLETLEEYMLVQGREWERFAWLKGRAVAPRAAIAAGAAAPLRGVVQPFVFRKYLDYSVFDSLRVLHRQIREHANRRSAGRPGRANDVKLSRGGIREVEFIVQLLQVVRGGQYPELRTRPTLKALQRVARAGLMPQATADALAAAYTFLRRVEHRIQYLDDQQTHVLPTRDDDLDWLAHTLGYASVCPFLGDLDAHRETVAEEFDRLLGGSVPCRTCGKKPDAPAPAAPAPNDLDEVAALVASAGVQEALTRWCREPRVQALRDSTRQRLLQLLVRTAGWLGEGRVGDTAVLRFIDWLDSLLRRESYYVLLLERPAVHERLLRVLGMARWPARYLMQHPGVIDELAGPSLLAQRFDAAQLERELEERRLALARGGEDDEENLLGLLRRAHQAEVFRTLVRDVERRITVEQVADDLSALADAILRVTVRWCWSRLRQRHRVVPRLGLIAYGKLGGKELGYGGDLDLVFVFDDDDERAPEVYAAFVRKLITWLSLQTGEGHLYDIDTALRPNGSSGLLVTRFDAYADYQQQRGSNTAWTWEHQAMTRARMVPPRSPAAQGALPPEGAAARLGSGPAADGVVPPHSPAAQGALPPEGAPAETDDEAFDLTARFDAVRHAVLTAPRDRAALRAEIADMRRRMHAANPVRPGLFDLKNSPGGMIDAEFVTQYLVLAHTAEHPELEPNLGNIALLIRAEDAGLLPPGVGRAGADAYRSLRFAQHIARLDEQPTQVPEESLAQERTAIGALWQAVFG
ncbi:MAG TPA: bifunctional [glutamate--ammonia ligase]-adenylyl-L-tyrosine phosphorylase/[glutamate--ammonia-ligase] adenylyltransferase [Ottowia sp.]|uniref:bifunctional [glutamate--ammonia ligase]-adenylyl-L-tyrosine phosphorylase/[glutamate--ammonia-ligase] adenylyltransferase n=1 Tax=Ottowia sp. TaxID=1898956 RepID=UPI002B7FC7E7|nr:bifunctional [glutamate--ammonia ligase]-adenylyl-L-tyrosine phosphorylase/[glutamate--ammonia-ligase] adenylyltransferase [Ottowia sp.]HMN21781.1 bifunctional [glutamate--ammonia ligase]-adenylyl-L-tyrosine phosphorylase/[glutamate--ammonia-ligase] adenylyltransferase [Ottowia sp.]